MQGVKSVFRSSIIKKALMGLTGLLMIGFLIAHLIANLLLFSNNPDPYNLYTHKLASMGWLLIAVELALVAFFLVHVVSGISVYLGSRKARGSNYVRTGDAGPPSRKNLASKTMIWTGIILFFFVIFHLITFKFGTNYPITVDGVEMRDLYRLVYEKFQELPYVISYVAIMVLLGYHLRHGFWSAFQSLGVHHPRYTPIIYGAGIVIALILAVGFLLMPIWIYINPLGVKIWS